MSIARANLLILRGVYLNDLTVEDSSTIGISSPLVEYDEIPKRFTSVTTWPQTTNLLCWSCGLLPLGPPAFVPANPEKDKDGGDVCDVVCNFCGWNCVIEYVMKELPEDQRWDALETVCLFESKFSGRRKEKIMPPLHRTKMAAYCGKGGLTAPEWRAEVARINTEYHLSQYKIEHLK